MMNLSKKAKNEPDRGKKMYRQGNILVMDSSFSFHSGVFATYVLLPFFARLLSRFHSIAYQKCFGFSSKPVLIIYFFGYVFSWVPFGLKVRMVGMDRLAGLLNFQTTCRSKKRAKEEINIGRPGFLSSSFSPPPPLNCSTFLSFSPSSIDPRPGKKRTRRRRRRRSHIS